MNSSVEKEYNIQHLIFGVVVGITIIAGLILNGFIAGVNITDWVKQRPVTATDQILTSIGISRMFYQTASLFHLFSYMLKRDVFIKYDFIVQNIWNIFFYAGIWLSTLLSVVFCLKISNFHNVFYLRLKITILQRVVHLIIASVLGSIFCNSMYFVITNIALPKSSTNGTYNSATSNLRLYMFFLWNTVPILIYFTSSVLLIFSLCHHIYVMTRDRTVTGQQDTYYKTIKYFFFSSFTYAIFFTTIGTVWFYKDSYGILGDLFVVNIFPTLYSTYLIYATTKLKTRFSAIIQHGISCLYNRKNS